MAAAPSKEVTNTQICSVSFGFYTDEEVKKLSVKRITSPYIFNTQGQPYENGLYDRAFGPLEGREKCGSCGLKAEQCPGHFGHIELPVPVFNPLTFPTLYKLMKSMCHNCFKLKMAQDEVEVYRTKLQLLHEGRLQEALSLGSARSEAKGKDKENLELPEKRPQKESSSIPDGDQGKPIVTSHTMEAIRATTSGLFSHMPSVKCSNCGAFNPTIKRQPGQKLFKVWKAARNLQRNHAKGIMMENVLGIPMSNSEMAQQLGKEMLESEHERQEQRKGKRKRAEAEGPGDAPEGEDQEEEDDDEKDDKDADMDDYAELDEDEKEDKEDIKYSDGKKEEQLGVGKTDEHGGAKKRAKTKGPELPPIASSDMAPQYVTAMEAEALMQRLWSREHAVLGLLFSADGITLHPPRQHSSKGGYHIFFLRSLPVTPNKFRPPSKMGDEKFEHPQNVLLQRILNACLDLHSGQQQQQGQQQVAAKQAEPAALNLDYSIATILRLQNLVAALMDSSTAEQTDVKGIRQALERKEGLFRMFMMGKRVNFAARSVISPDPYIGTGEIGIPPYFAKRLSFPERVTPWNVQWLRELVMRGPDIHPGALAVEDEHGRLVNLRHLNQQRREALAKQLLSGYSGGKPGAGSALQSSSGRQLPGGSGSKIVYRHLMDGDIMLTNRQPTLHKPGLMAHRARVLKGERTIRMHYANCATFNADFDGDEINLHLPQDQHGRAEGYGIVHSDEQYIVPTDGKPIRGLIQDHVVSGVLLTKKDTFLTRQQYMQLLMVACTDSKLAAAKHDVDFELVPPAILRPQPLWTGKQLLSAMLRHITRGLPPLTMDREGKVPIEYWGKHSGEGAVNFYKGELVAGCLDKNQYGKYGLVHAVQELYGAKAAGQLLSAFSRLFTSYLQFHGFTCGLDDLMLRQPAEAQRLKLLATAEATATAASATFVHQPLPENLVKNPGQHQHELQAAGRRVAAALSERYRSDKATGIGHDKVTTSVMHPLSSEVVKSCLPSGQVKPFPRNCLSLMTITGAKGSLVNFSQISCLLGQQELEGRRVPRMASGKTLPCFRPFDPGARSGGFVGDRFLTGLRPQEYYFHCMAGREGLVDTAVKTSRSGYLQRCMIKNLETLRVAYDCSVRDSVDDSLVQFYYGEDGLDVTTVSYLQQFGFLARNGERFAQQLSLTAARDAGTVANLEGREEEVHKAAKRRQKLLSKGSSDAEQVAKSLPVMADAPPTVLGAHSEAFADTLARYLDANPDQLLASRKDVKKGKAPKGAIASEDFATLMALKYMRSLAAPGEAVGVLAGQSIGEPSTQMTLNTFHMAGRGEANVTLGIPRLREILMTAAKKIKTPVMTLPLHAGMGVTHAQTLANRMRRIRLAECLEGISVQETPVSRLYDSQDYARTYTVTLRFFDPALFPKEASLTFDDLVTCFQHFCTKLRVEVQRAVKRAGGAGITVVALSATDDDPNKAGPGGEGEEDGNGEAGGSQRGRGKAQRGGEDEDDEEAGEDEENEELREGKLRFRGEAAGADNDEDDEGEDTAEAEEDGEEVIAEAVDLDIEALPPTPSTSGKGKQAKAAKGAAKPGKGKKGAADPGLPELEVLVDRAGHSCSMRLMLPLESPKILLLEVVERVAATTMLRATEAIDKCYVVQAKNSDKVSVQTDGLNFEAAWANSDLVDTSRVTTNDVAAVLRTYGVEAARGTIVAEASGVFNAYGIAVDRRHLSLIADFMTHQGGYRPCNRLGIDTSPSPLLKMSFETAAAFLVDATLKGSADTLRSPSSRIVVGRVVEMGTGAVQLVQQL